MACSSSKITADNQLFKSKWVLSELNGTPVQLSGTDKDAHLNFSFAEMLVSGSGGCNRLTGTFNAKGKDFSFNPLATTKMMCMDEKFETAFLTALGKVNKYDLVNNALELKQGDAVLAKLIPR
ncbi:MAG TPA: META domain-containing protein [Panacibacter sp.]|nr:META domain-containing protein [Panacibacter sp.]